MKTPKVSIISGYYNRENWVFDSIESLRNQIYDNLEIIIFDDHSTDRTYQNLCKACLNDPRIKLIRHEKNIGFVNGLVEAIELSSGDYIAIHGSGDISLPNRIGKQVLSLEENPNIVGVDCYYVNSDSRNGTRKEVCNKGTFTKSDFMKSNPLSHGGVMFRKEIYNDIGGYRRAFKYAQDFDLWLRMSEHGNFYIVPEFLYERRINFDGVSYKPDKFIMQRKYCLLAKKIQYMPNAEQCSVLNNVITHGINSIIPTRDKYIQNHIIFMFNVLCAKNRLSDHNIFLDNTTGLRNLYIVVVSFFMKIKPIRLSINLIYRNVR